MFDAARSEEHGKTGHSKKPANQKLWDMLTLRAKVKFVNRWPSFAATKWLHDEYVRMGGQFEDTVSKGKSKKVQKQHKALHDARREAIIKESIRQERQKQKDHKKRSEKRDD